MTVTAPTNQNRPHWLYQTLAIVGITVGIFVIAAGLYLLLVPRPAAPACKPPLVPLSRAAGGKPFNTNHLRPTKY